MCFYVSLDGKFIAYPCQPIVIHNGRKNATNGMQKPKMRWKRVEKEKNKEQGENKGKLYRKVELPTYQIQHQPPFI